MRTHCREGDWDQKVGIWGAPFLAVHLVVSLTCPPSLIVLRALEDWGLALGINNSCIKAGPVRSICGGILGGGGLGG